MLKGILGFVLFIFFVLVFIGILIGGRIYSTIQKAKKAVQQEHQRRTETGRQRQQYSQRQQSQNAPNAHSSQNTYSDQREEDYQPEARRTQTATGETIIDNRHQERENKKIFDDSDGEYVEFEEA